MVIDVIKAIYFVSMILTTTALSLAKIFLLEAWGKITKKPITTNQIHEIAICWGRTVISRTPGWRVEAQGLEHLPAPGKSYVMVANHESAADILGLYTLGIQFRWLAKASILSIPIFGRAMKLGGYVPVSRGNKNSHVQALRESAARLKSGVPMLFFPEGTRSTLGYPQKFKVGAFKLASDCGVEVVPAVLSGAGKLLRKGSAVPHPATMKIQILPSVSILPNESVDEFAERVHGLISQAHKTLSA